MRTLIIPDVHERMDRLSQALEPRRLANVNRIVFLGDWFDTFKEFSAERVEGICNFLMGVIHLGGYVIRSGDAPIKTELLLGNHDVHYFFDNEGYACSGYHPRRKNIIKHMMAPENIARFDICTEVGPYLLSHAGFHPGNLNDATEESCLEAIQEALQGGYSPLFGCGKARGGTLPLGGPTWLDWHDEFAHIPGAPQIVGHTHGEKVRSKGPHCLRPMGEDCIPGEEQCEGCAAPRSWCIDTGLRDVAYIDEETGAITIEHLDA